MKRTKLVCLFTLLCIGAAFSLPASAQDESIVLDPDTGNYIITFRSTFPSRELHRIVFVPATKIDPLVKSKFKATDGGGTISYGYKIKNDDKAKQSLISFRFIASSVVKSDQITPKGWYGNVLQNIGGRGVRINWHFGNLGENENKGLLPGESQNGFSIKSQDLPGIATARLSGNTPVLALPDEGPAMDSEVGKQLNQLTANDFVPRPAAVPLIPVPSPFDAAAVLTSLQKHVKEDLVGMTLIEPVLASRLDPLFAVAIDAAQRGNAEGTRKAIKDIRHLLKREHEDVDKNDDDEAEDDDQDDKKKNQHKNKRLIDKLAAKVLDFDLRYVEKRVKGPLE